MSRKEHFPQEAHGSWSWKCTLTQQSPPCTNTETFKSEYHTLFTLIAAMSLVGGGRGLLGSGLVAAGGSPGTNLYRYELENKWTGFFYFKVSKSKLLP